MEEIDNQGLAFFRKVGVKICRESYLEFLKLFCLYVEGKIEKSNFTNAVSTLIGRYDELMDHFLHFINNCENLNSGFPRNIVHDNLAQKKTCTPSYKNGSNASGCDRTGPSGLGSEALKEGSPSVSEGVESRSCKRKRTDEDIQRVKNKRDDDRHEFDMLLRWLKSAANYAKNLSTDNVKKLGGISRTHFERCMERLYGDEGAFILELCQENPQSVSAVVLCRLNQKIEQLKKFGVELEKIWVNV